MGYILPVSNPIYVQYAERMRQQSDGIPRVSSVHRVNKYEQNSKKGSYEADNMNKRRFPRYLEQELKGYYINETV
ncbi:hypothetical protein ACFFJY_12335 [Fictibacillus aquaticus]|nr:hypothetical protein [Fictibacillus aquaticus]